MTVREFIRDAADGDRFAMRTEEDGLAHEFAIHDAFSDGSDAKVINASCFDGFFDRSEIDQEMPERVDCIGCLAEERVQWLKQMKSR